MSQNPKTKQPIHKQQLLWKTYTMHMELVSPTSSVTNQPKLEEPWQIFHSALAQSSCFRPDYPKILFFSVLPVLGDKTLSTCTYDEMNCEQIKFGAAGVNSDWARAVYSFSPYNTMPIGVCITYWKKGQQGKIVQVWYNHSVSSWSPL